MSVSIPKKTRHIIACCFFWNKLPPALPPTPTPTPILHQSLFKVLLTPSSHLQRTLSSPSDCVSLMRLTNVGVPKEWCYFLRCSISPIAGLMSRTAVMLRVFADITLGTERAAALLEEAAATWSCGWTCVLCHSQISALALCLYQRTIARLGCQKHHTVCYTPTTYRNSSETIISFCRCTGLWENNTQKTDYWYKTWTVFEISSAGLSYAIILSHWEWLLEHINKQSPKT